LLGERVDSVVVKELKSQRAKELRALMAELRIRFNTKLEDELFQRASGVELEVPGSVRRSGLSGVVLQLLDLPEERSESVAFDFLIGGELLRGDLLSFCEGKGLGTETAVDVEYVLRRSKLEAEEQNVHLDEYVCSIDTHVGQEGPIHAAGMYDGTVKFMRGSNVVGLLRINENPVKCVRWTPNGNIVCASGSGIVSIYSVDFSGGFTTKCLLTGAGPCGQSLECVECVPEGDRIASGSFSGGLYVFETSREANDTLLEIRDVKRQKAKTQGPIAAVPSRELEGHSSTVSSLLWLGERGLVSASWDGTVCLWNVDAAERLRMMPISGKAAMNISAREDLIAAACTDGAVRLLDLRLEEAMKVQTLARAHSRMASAVAWRPDGQYELASAGYDSAVKIWDIRAVSKPLFKRTEAHGADGKATCLRWANASQLLSGGADGNVKMYSFGRLSN